MLNSDHVRPQDMARFSMEAEASAQLQHAGIVQVFDVGNVNGLPYFTQEYVIGGTLASKIAKQMLSHEETARTILAITKAELPDAEIVHEMLCENLGRKDIFLISAVTGQGLNTLVNKIATLLAEQNAELAAAAL